MSLVPCEAGDSRDRVSGASCYLLMVQISSHGSPIAFSKTMACGHVPIGKRPPPRSSLPCPITCDQWGPEDRTANYRKLFLQTPTPPLRDPSPSAPSPPSPSGARALLCGVSGPLSHVALWRVIEKGHFSALQLPPSVLGRRRAHMCNRFTHGEAVRAGG